CSCPLGSAGSRTARLSISRSKPIIQPPIRLSFILTRHVPRLSPFICVCLLGRIPEQESPLTAHGSKVPSRREGFVPSREAGRRTTASNTKLECRFGC